jgi:citrate synthase
MMGEDDQRISRPRQIYTGPDRRDLVNLDKR